MAAKQRSSMSSSELFEIAKNGAILTDDERAKLNSSQLIALPFNEFVAGKTSECLQCGCRNQMPLKESPASERTNKQRRQHLEKSGSVHQVRRRSVKSVKALPATDISVSPNVLLDCPYCHCSITVARWRSVEGKCPNCHELVSAMPAAWASTSHIENDPDDFSDGHEFISEKRAKLTQEAEELQRARPVAEWMVAKFTQTDFFWQSEAVRGIKEAFGEEFIYINDNGNPAILPSVLQEFRRLTEGKAVWDKHNRYWRQRRQDEDPNRRAVE